MNKVNKIIVHDKIVPIKLYLIKKIKLNKTTP